MWNEFLQPEDCLASTHGADASDNYGMQQSGTVSDQPWLQPDAYRYSNCQHVSNAAAFDQRDHTKEGFADLDSMPSGTLSAHTSIALNTCYPQTA